MTLTRISYEDQQAVMDGRMTKEEALRRADPDAACDPEPRCPECNGEMQDADHDGSMIKVCEDCGLSDAADATWTPVNPTNWERPS